jgi:hypothetical protein
MIPGVRRAPRETEGQIENSENGRISKPLLVSRQNPDLWDLHALLLDR